MSLHATSCKSMQVCKVAKQSELKYATLPLLSRFLVPCLSLRIIGHFPTPGKIELALQDIMITEFFSSFLLCSCIVFCSTGEWVSAFPKQIFVLFSTLM